LKISYLYTISFKYKFYLSSQIDSYYYITIILVDKSIIFRVLNCSMHTTSTNISRTCIVSVAKWDLWT